MDWDDLAKIDILFGDEFDRIDAVRKKRRRLARMTAYSPSCASSDESSQFEKELIKRRAFDYHRELKRMKRSTIFASIFTLTALIFYFTGTIWPFFTLLFFSLPSYLCMFFIEDKGHNSTVKTIINEQDQGKFRDAARSKCIIALIFLLLNTYYFIGSGLHLGPEGLFLSDILSGLILFGFFRSFILAFSDADNHRLITVQNSIEYSLTQLFNFYYCKSGCSYPHFPECRIYIFLYNNYCVMNKNDQICSL